MRVAVLATSGSTGHQLAAQDLDRGADVSGTGIIVVPLP